MTFGYVEYRSHPNEYQFYRKTAGYLAEQVKQADYQNASEVVRDALRLHEIYRHRVIENLRAEIKRGWDGPASVRNVEDIIKAKCEESQV